MINSILYAGPWDPETLRAALTAAGHENKIYELTGPEALSHEQIAQKLSAAVGKQIKYLDISPAAFKESAIAAGMPELYVDALLNLYQLYVAGGAQRVTKDVERVTGSKPRTFDEFARDHAAAFR